MPKFDFEAFKKYCEENNLFPMLVIYGKQDGESVTLDFLTTEVYDNADNQLKMDVTEATGKVYQQMKG